MVWCVAEELGRLRNAKEINLESLSVMNLGLGKSNFRLDMGYRAENLAMDKPKFIAKIQFYFFLVPKYSNTKKRYLRHTS